MLANHYYIFLVLLWLEDSASCGMKSVWTTFEYCKHVKFDPLKNMIEQLYFISKVHPVHHRFGIILCKYRLVVNARATCFVAAIFVYILLFSMNMRESLRFTEFLYNFKLISKHESNSKIVLFFTHISGPSTSERLL